MWLVFGCETYFLKNSKNSKIIKKNLKNNIIDNFSKKINFLFDFHNKIISGVSVSHCIAWQFHNQGRVCLFFYLIYPTICVYIVIYYTLFIIIFSRHKKMALVFSWNYVLLLLSIFLSVLLNLNGVESTHQVIPEFQSIPAFNVKLVHRTAYHFQPKKHWINGMSGVYPTHSCIHIQL